MRVSIKLPTGKVISNEFKESSITIGRSNKCDLPIPDESLSRNHAQLEVIDGDFFVTDLGSANGIFIDGTRIPAQTRTKFNSFQQLTIATLDCQVEDTSEVEVKPSLHVRSRPESRPERAPESSSSDKEQRRPGPGTSSHRKTAPTQKTSASRNSFKMIPLVLLVIGAGIYFYFKSADEAATESKSPDEQLILSNVPEALRDVKDDFTDYMVTYASNGCDKNAELCKEMQLSTQNGEGIVREAKEAFVFFAPSTHLEAPTFAKIKESPEASDIVALYMLLNSSLMKEFDKKALGQVHLVILDKDLKQTKAFRFHQKYFAGNEITRMLTELGDVIDNGAKTQAFWAYATPLIKIKSF